VADLQTGCLSYSQTNSIKALKHMYRHTSQGATVPPTGDLLLAGAAGCWVTAQACVQALDGDLKTAWLSFSDESALKVSVTQDVLYKSTSYLTLPYMK